MTHTIRESIVIWHASLVIIQSMKDMAKRTLFPTICLISQRRVWPQSSDLLISYNSEYSTRRCLRRYHWELIHKRHDLLIHSVPFVYSSTRSLLNPQTIYIYLIKMLLISRVTKMSVLRIYLIRLACRLSPTFQLLYRSAVNAYEQRFECLYILCDLNIYWRTTLQWRKHEHHLLHSIWLSACAKWILLGNAKCDQNSHQCTYYMELEHAHIHMPLCVEVGVCDNTHIYVYIFLMNLCVFLEEI